MSSGHLTTYQPSTYDPTPPRQFNYEVLHFQNRGQNQIASTKIGTFASLQDAQHAAQDTLRSALEGCLAKGWIGYYCNDIDLEFRGLITGLVGEIDYACLSEVHIYAKARPYEPFQGQPASADEQWRALPSRQHSHTYAEYEEI
ncbi:uncharacterized protein EKO05_0006205 [Ascochyta rabiei]|nr:uncharacterized protein EKO05_0006205 [Ascochyta rabiei]UPX15766.1 hypothetical protein EKO05_0006205 [Ascochyta rabiei]